MQKKKKMTLEEFQENETPGLLAIYDFTSNIAISNYIDTTAVKYRRHAIQVACLLRHIFSAKLI